MTALSCCLAGLRCSRPAIRRRAFSMIETTISVVIVGVTLVAALNTFGAAAMGQAKTADRSIGQLLAQDLMSEILQQAYEEPDDTPGFGRESGESGGHRENWDDIDDYDDLDESPPELKDRTAMSGLSGWQRHVKVEWVSALDLLLGGLTDSGIKRITVTATKNNIVFGTATAIRTDAWQQPGGG